MKIEKGPTSSNKYGEIILYNRKQIQCDMKKTMWKWKPKDFLVN